MARFGFWSVGLLRAMALGVVAAALSLALTALPAPGASQARAGGSPNIILVLADDLDAAATAMMPKLRTLLVDQGLSFESAYVVNPRCCPSRSTILRGQYSHSHGVLTNGPPNGGFQRFFELGHEASTFATWLQSAGYRTVLLGKYLNGYPETAPATTYIPLGWSEWYGAVGGMAHRGYNYEINENGTIVEYGARPRDYFTDVLARKATRFIQNSGDAPFFMWLAPSAPHEPAKPAPRHIDRFPGAKAPRVPSFDEVDVSDKPMFVRDQLRLTEPDISQLDQLYRRRLQSMLAVDDLLQGLVDALEGAGKLENTFIFFTSDNGFHLGQHRLRAGKNTAYEEDVHVPLFVRGPDVPAGQHREHIVLNTDFAPTFAALAGASTPSFVEGRSLQPLLGVSPPRPSNWRKRFLIEHWPARDIPEYQGVLTERFKYIEYESGERELYNRRRDPYELWSVHATADPILLGQLSERLHALYACAGADCRALED